MIIFQSLKKNKCEYITLTEAVSLTSTLSLKYFEPDLNTFNSKPDLYADHPAKFQKSKGRQTFS